MKIFGRIIGVVSAGFLGALVLFFTAYFVGILERVSPEARELACRTVEFVFPPHVPDDERMYIVLSRIDEDEEEQAIGALRRAFRRNENLLQHFRSRTHCERINLRESDDTQFALYNAERRAQQILLDEGAHMIIWGSHDQNNDVVDLYVTSSLVPTDFAVTSIDVKLADELMEELIYLRLVDHVSHFDAEARGPIFIAMAENTVQIARISENHREFMEEMEFHNFRLAIARILANVGERVGDPQLLDAAAGILDGIVSVDDDTRGQQITQEWAEIHGRSYYLLGRIFGDYTYQHADDLCWPISSEADILEFYSATPETNCQKAQFYFAQAFRIAGEILNDEVNKAGAYLNLLTLYAKHVGLTDNEEEMDEMLRITIELGRDVIRTVPDREMREGGWWNFYIAAVNTTAAALVDLGRLRRDEALIMQGVDLFEEVIHALRIDGYQELSPVTSAVLEANFSSAYWYLLGILGVHSNTEYALDGERALNAAWQRFDEINISNQDRVLYLQLLIVQAERHEILARTLFNAEYFRQSQSCLDEAEAVARLIGGDGSALQRRLSRVREDIGELATFFSEDSDNDRREQVEVGCR